MILRSNRFSADPVLEKCAAGTHRMLKPEENLSVLRVQEGLRRLGYDPGDLDGIFGDTTGGAVTQFKLDNGLSPSDPVVGAGTSTTLDNLLFEDPLLDPDFGELSGFVAAHNVEPFVGLQLHQFLSAPLDSQRQDVGRFMLDALRSGDILGIIANGRALGMTDARIPLADKQFLAAMPSFASGVNHHFTGTDGLPHIVIGLNDLLIRGRMVLTHRPTNRKAKASFRGQLSHEMTHLRNKALRFDETPDSDAATFVDTAWAAHFSQTSPRVSAIPFATFADEMNARHMTWVIEKEIAGDPFAARFLQPAKLAQAAHFYFAESDVNFYFNDNGYIAKIVSFGHQPKYQQMAMWLRRCAAMTFSSSVDAQKISEQLFLDAADWAEAFASNPALPKPDGDGLWPGPSDYH